MDTTSTSLLERVRSGKDPDAWRRFVNLYTPLIQQWTRRNGLQTHDADDVAQDVLVKVHAEMPGFQYDPAKGHFRGWLRGVMVNCLRAYWRKKKPTPIGAGDSELPNRLHELEDPHSGISAMWDREHDAFVTQRCLDMIRTDFEPQTWQAFILVVQEGMDGKEAAKKLGLSRSTVYTAKSRVLARLREEVAGLVD